VKRAVERPELAPTEAFAHSTRRSRPSADEEYAILALARPKSKRHLKITLVAAAVAAASLATPAVAAESEFSRFFKGLFGAGSGYACFMRTYDQAHLDAHPRQNVASVLMLADVVHPGEPITLRLRFGFRTPKVELDTWGVCEGQHVGSGLKCYVVDMGGELDVGVAFNEPALLSMPKPVKLWKIGHGPEDPEARPPFGTDDKVFRLERWSDETCAALPRDAQERARMTAPYVSKRVGAKYTKRPARSTIRPRRQTPENRRRQFLPKIEIRAKLNRQRVRQAIAGRPVSPPRPRGDLEKTRFRLDRPIIP